MIRFTSCTRLCSLGLPFLVLSLGLSSSVRAQPSATLLFELNGTGPDHRFGRSVADVGDVDGDGTPDFVVGASQGGPWPDHPGYAHVYSGASGTRLLVLGGSSPNDWFGQSVAGAGDVNGDGVPDIVVGAPADDPGGMTSAGRAFVFSGMDGALLLTLGGTAPGEYFGDSVSGAGDVDGDGHADVIIGSWNADAAGAEGAGRATLFSGSSGAIIRTFVGSELYWMGDAVGFAGDLDGDGIPDQIVSATGGNPTSTPDLEAYGHVYVKAGSDGSTLWQARGDHVWDYLGYAAIPLGDMDGDLVTEFAATLALGTGGAVETTDAVRIFSGSSAAVQMEVRGMGTSLASTGDVDGDGVPDIAISDFTLREVRVISGATGMTLFAMGGFDSFWDGPAIAMVGDKLVVGASAADPGGLIDAGQVKVYALTASGSPPPQEAVSQSEQAVSGTVSGTYLDTAAPDGATEVIEEVESGGKPSNRRSFLEHKWVIQAPVGSTITFHVRAWHSPNGEGDDFLFEYSLDDQTYAPLLTVTKTADDGQYDSAALQGASGQIIYVRLTDTDRTPGNRNLDRIDIDHLFIRAEGQAPPAPPPAAPSGLTAIALSGERVHLCWDHSGGNATGVRVERSVDGVVWAPLVTIVAQNAGSILDSAAGPSTTWHYRVQAFGTGGDSPWSAAAMTATHPNGTSVSHAIAEAPLAGFVSGERLDTWSDDAFSMSIEEWTTSGNRRQRQSYLEHVWTFDLPAGSTATLAVQAWHTPNAEGDDILFEYSFDGATYLPLMLVTKTADDDRYQTATIPVTPGPLYIRATDTDRTPGNRDKDSLHVDHMMIYTLP